MSIIPEKTDLAKSFWLYFHIKGNGTEWIDYNLPTPTIHKHINRGYFIGWAIDGYFGTHKGSTFLNDIVARFLLTFRENDIKRLPFKPKIKDFDDNTVKIHKKVYKLREFSVLLNSLPVKQYAPRRADKFDDYTFWAIKLYAEDLIKDYSLIPYDSLENWALTQFEKKERSTVKAKCRSVWDWYDIRNFEIPKKHKSQKEYLEITLATRKEHMKKVSKEKAERNKRTVINIMTGLYANDYKKKNGAWHYGKISEATGLSSKTVAKIIKEL